MSLSLQALGYCTDPQMIEKIVTVLSKPELGKKEQADEIKAIHEDYKKAPPMHQGTHSK